MAESQNVVGDVNVVVVVVGDVNAVGSHVAVAVAVAVNVHVNAHVNVHVVEITLDQGEIA
ncbi:MAG: hypothetical protein HYZ28_27860 [Myxococcales bacterium]|nr:hypothetical protein [Myxococcales bacterium]